jgi:predicted alpha/beta-hydrolase family hydrolase
MSRPLQALADLGATAHPSQGDVEGLLVLAHGAGADQRHPFMTGVASGLALRHVDVVTFDFPYMRNRRRVPDRAPVLERAFREVIEVARSWSRTPRLFIGGKSMGGRMATHLGAAGLDRLSGIVVFGYPLHPPGKPTELRVAHLSSVSVPVFIVQGERDTFGTPAELKPYVDGMTAATLYVVERGDHSLSVKGRARAEVLDQVLDATAAWMRDANAP